MDFKAKLAGLSRTLTGKTLITLETDADAADIERLEGDLKCSLSRFRNKRSLDANAYYHLLCGKIANAIGSSMTEVCNRMIAEYGQVDLDVKTIIMRADIDWQRLEYMHLRPTTKTREMDNGQLFRVYIVMRGSHTYDTAEMSKLIAGVVSEAQELGIDTMTPAERERMLALWKE